MYIYIHVLILYIYIHTYIYLNIYIYIHIFEYIYIHIWKKKYIYVYIFEYIYIFIFDSKYIIYIWLYMVVGVYFIDSWIKHDEITSGSPGLTGQVEAPGNLPPLRSAWNEHLASSWRIRRRVDGTLPSNISRLSPVTKGPRVNIPGWYLGYFGIEKTSMGFSIIS